MPLKLFYECKNCSIIICGFELFRKKFHLMKNEIQMSFSRIVEETFFTTQTSL